MVPAWSRRFPEENQKRNSPEDTIRALGLMATYFSMASRHHSRDSTWAAIALAAKLCKGAGLHRDPARWNLPPALVQRRRALFWEVYQSDISHSIALGRPPTTPLSFVDCEYADEDLVAIKLSAISSTNIAETRSFPSWISYSPRTQRNARIEKFSSSTRRYGDCRYPYRLQITPSKHSMPGSSSMLCYLRFIDPTWQGLFSMETKPLHRMLTQVDHLIPSTAQTPYASSVAAAYHAAEEISRSLHGFVVTDDELAGRVWFLTYRGFSAAVSLTLTYLVK
ncbi:hypothetical protein GGU11DRAFT_223212 [Lentinula aff. detonsa]|nr:hypothetical protein GGU11DRAFT_223212 [Lentinula aff. detonsa]